jgi:hypothetical protein
MRRTLYQTLFAIKFPDFYVQSHAFADVDIFTLALELYAEDAKLPIQ